MASTASSTLHIDSPVSSNTPAQTDPAAPSPVTQQVPASSLPPNQSNAATSNINPAGGSSTQATLPPVTASTALPSSSTSAASPGRLRRVYDRICNASKLEQFIAALTVLAIILAMRYGEPAIRSTRWTMLNDFRASCVSDRDVGRPLSTSCEKALAGPPPPPPLEKREEIEAGEEEQYTRLLFEGSRWLVLVVHVTMIWGPLMKGDAMRLLLRLLRLVTGADNGLRRRPNVLESYDPSLDYIASDLRRRTVAHAKDADLSIRRGPVFSQDEWADKTGRLDPDARLRDLDETQRTPQWERHLNAGSDCKSPWSRKIVLNLPDDGATSVASLICLRGLIDKIREVEQSLQPKHMSSSAYFTDFEPFEDDYRLCHYVDYFVGSGSGGLNAMMLGRLRYSIPEAISDFHKLTDKLDGITSHSEGENVDPLTRSALLRRRYEQALEEVFEYRGHKPNAYRKSREDTRHPKHPSLEHSNAMAAQTIMMARNVSGKLPPFFSSVPRKRISSARQTRVTGRSAKSNQSKPLHKVAWVTIATPSPLPSTQVRTEDDQDETPIAQGRLNAIACKAVENLCSGLLPSLIISVGTGTYGLEESGPQTDTSVQGAERPSKAAQEGQPKRPMNACELPQTHDDLPKSFSFLIPPGKIGHIQTLDAIAKVAQNYLQTAEVDQELRRCALQLVQIRRQRQATVRWEAFAQDTVYYTCPEKELSTECAGLAFRHRPDLRQHAERNHGFAEGFSCPSPGCNWWATFNREQLVLDHLERAHGFKDPGVMTTEEYEQWLDNGRRKALPDKIPENAFFSASETLFS